jgi:hypothetical protein
MQLQCLSRVVNNQSIECYAADTMEQLKLEQFGKDVLFQQIDSWYEIESVFQDKVFDMIIYMDDIMKLRNPEKFLSAVYKRLSINGKFFFQVDNSGCLLALNYILMTQRDSPRDAVRLRKNNTAATNDVVALLNNVGLSVDMIENTFYHETFTYADMESINNYRELFKGSDITDFEQNIRSPGINIIARKPGKVDTHHTLEQLLYMKKRTD